VVNAEAGREPHARDQSIALLESLVASQGANGVFDPDGDLRERLSRPNILLRPLPNLPMSFGGVAVVVNKLALKIVEMALLLAGRTVAVLVHIFNLLALWILLVREELRDQDSGRVRLLLWVLLLLPGLSLLLFLSGTAFTAGRGRVFSVIFGPIAIVI
jgi:hypothetical protein